MAPLESYNLTHVDPAPGTARLVWLDVVEGGNFSATMANQRTEEARRADDGGGVQESCGRLSLRIFSRDDELLSHEDQAWGESRGHLLSMGGAGRNASETHPYAVDSLWFRVDFAKEMKGLQAPLGGRILLALQEREGPGSHYDPYLALQSEGARFALNRTEEHPYICGIGLHHFGETHVSSGAPGAPLALARDARMGVQTALSSSASFLVALYPPPYGVSCQVGIELDGRRVAENASGPLPGVCLVRFAGGAGSLDLVIDQLASYSPWVAFEVLDLPPGLQRLLRPFPPSA